MKVSETMFFTARPLRDFANGYNGYLRKRCDPRHSSPTVHPTFMWWPEDGPQVIANSLIKRWSLISLPLTLGWPHELF